MNDFNVLSLMGTYYWENRVLYTIIFLIISISPLVKYFYLPYKYGEVFTKIKGSSSNFIKYLKTLFVLILVLQGTFTLGPYLVTRNSAYFTDFMIHRVYQHIYENSIYNYNNLNVSELVIKIAKMNYFSNKFYYFIRELFTFSVIPLVTLTGYCYINLPPVFFKVMCVFTLLIVCVQYINVSLSKVELTKKEKFFDILVGQIGDSLQNLETIHIFDSLGFDLKYIKTFFSEFLKQHIKATLFITGFDGLLRAMVVGLYAIMHSLLFQAYREKQVSIDNFLRHFLVFNQSIIVLEAIGTYLKAISELFGEMEEINNYFKKTVPPVVQNIKSGKNRFRNGVIEVRNVSYQYSQKNKIALNNVSLKIQPGEKIAFVGHSGSGKSTMAKLLTKFLPLTIGSITINGDDIRQLSLKEIKRNIFFIPQNPRLFNRTLYHNITYSIKNPPSAKEIISVLENYKLDVVKKIFKEKMNQPVGVDGSLLSGGQRQIVWLLRAMFNLSPIIVMDEPTASLDPKLKRQMIEIIKKITVGKTVILISHDDIDRDFRKITFHKGQVIN